ncbi:MAG TPA: hypothetical protein VMZ91_15835 [Candidatus Paceibacterota bacterium]|nr:hypothetical protein [Candidatus Paceibacterota bacterium]
MKCTKCENCGDNIAGEPAFICNETTNNKNLEVCQYCYKKLKIGRTNSEGGLIKTYMNWLQRK